MDDGRLGRVILRLAVEPHLFPGKASREEPPQPTDLRRVQGGLVKP